MTFDIVFALLNGINLSIIMNIPPVLSELMDLYGVSYTQISVLMSALLWMHAAMQLPAGMIIDRLGIRRTQFLSLICLAVGNALPAIHPDLTWGIVGRMIAGLGTGLSRLSGGFVILRISPLTVLHGSLLVLGILFAGMAVTRRPGMVLGLALLAAWFGSINFGALFQLAS